MKKPSVKQGPFPIFLRLKFLPTLLLAISAFLINHGSCHNVDHASCCSVEVYFTPGDPCMDMIVNKILDAKHTILVQAYVFTSQRILDALIKAYQNKVHVQVLVDKNAFTSRGSKIPIMLQHGIPIIIDKTLGLAHNKIMIIDDDCVITGSFNWTDGAQTKNAENIVIIKSRKKNRMFATNWHKRASGGA